MLALTLAQELTRLVLSFARENSLAPLAVAVLDARASVKALAAEDGVPIGWSDIAVGKARGALLMGVDSRILGQQAVERPHFIAGVNHVLGGAVVPVAGGVLLRVDSVIVGAVGVAGDTSDRDEAAAKAAISLAFQGQITPLE